MDPKATALGKGYKGMPGALLIPPPPQDHLIHVLLGPSRLAGDTMGQADSAPSSV